MKCISDYLEIEYKYSAKNIKLTQFKKELLKMSPLDSFEISSYDIYYCNKNDVIRFRKNKKESELTIKRKSTKTNNQNRVEVNLPISTDDEKLVESFISLLNYKKNFKIYKSCWIFWFEKVNIVWYIVYNEEMKEVGKFLEIECNEHVVRNEGYKKAFEYLKEYESLLTSLNIGPHNRLKKSLWENYRN